MEEGGGVGWMRAREGAGVLANSMPLVCWLLYLSTSQLLLSANIGQK